MPSDNTWRTFVTQNWPELFLLFNHSHWPWPVSIETTRFAAISITSNQFYRSNLNSSWSSKKKKNDLRLRNLMATVLQMVDFIMWECRRGPFTTPRWTSPKHPSPSCSSKMMFPEGISHPSSKRSLRAVIPSQATLWLPLVDMIGACTEIKQTQINCLSTKHQWVIFLYINHGRISQYWPFFLSVLSLQWSYFNTLYTYTECLKALLVCTGYERQCSESGWPFGCPYSILPFHHPSCW